MTQVVSDLPAGKYLLTVRAKSSGAIPTFFISGNGVQQNITHPNGVFGNGWDENSVTFTVGNSCQATILLKAEKESDGTVGHWFKIDNFRLTRYPKMPTFVSDVRRSIIPDANDNIYDLMGRRLGGIPSSGFYIRGGKKFFVP